jgi:hypothetical protein
MASLFLLAGMKLVSGNTGAIFKVVLSCAVSTLLVSYLIIIPAIMKLNRKFRTVERPFVTPGGQRGFQIMGWIVLAFIAIGSMGVVFPGTIEGLLGIDYSFKDIWGLSRGQVELFTLGTIAFDLLVGFIGYIWGSKVRSDLVKQSEI